MKCFGTLFKQITRHSVRLCALVRTVRFSKCRRAVCCCHFVQAKRVHDNFIIIVFPLPRNNAPEPGCVCVYTCNTSGVDKYQTNSINTAFSPVMVPDLPTYTRAQLSVSTVMTRNSFLITFCCAACKNAKERAYISLD